MKFRNVCYGILAVVITAALAVGISLGIIFGLKKSGQSEQTPNKFNNILKYQDGFSSDFTFENQLKSGFHIFAESQKSSTENFELSELNLPRYSDEMSDFADLVSPVLEFNNSPELCVQFVRIQSDDFEMHIQVFIRITEKENFKFFKDWFVCQHNLKLTIPPNVYQLKLRFLTKASSGEEIIMDKLLISKEPCWKNSKSSQYALVAKIKNTKENPALAISELLEGVQDKCLIIEYFSKSSGFKSALTLNFLLGDSLQSPSTSFYLKESNMTKKEIICDVPSKPFKIAVKASSDESTEHGFAYITQIDLIDYPERRIPKTNYTFCDFSNGLCGYKIVNDLSSPLEWQYSKEEGLVKLQIMDTNNKAAIFSTPTLDQHYGYLTFNLYSTDKSISVDIIAISKYENYETNSFLTIFSNCKQKNYVRLTPGLNKIHFKVHNAISTKGNYLLANLNNYYTLYPLITSPYITTNDPVCVHFEYRITIKNSQETDVYLLIFKTLPNDHSDNSSSVVDVIQRPNNQWNRQQFNYHYDGTGYGRISFRAGLSKALLGDEIAINYILISEGQCQNPTLNVENDITSNCNFRNGMCGFEIRQDTSSHVFEQSSYAFEQIYLVSPLLSNSTIDRCLMLEIYDDKIKKTILFPMEVYVKDESGWQSKSIFFENFSQFPIPKNAIQFKVKFLKQNRESHFLRINNVNLRDFPCQSEWKNSLCTFEKDTCDFEIESSLPSSKWFWNIDYLTFGNLKGKYEKLAVTLTTGNGNVPLNTYTKLFSPSIESNGNCIAFEYFADLHSNLEVYINEGENIFKQFSYFKSKYWQSECICDLPKNKFKIVFKTVRRTSFDNTVAINSVYWMSKTKCNLLKDPIKQSFDCDFMKHMCGYTINHPLNQGYGWSKNIFDKYKYEAHYDKLGICSISSEDLYKSQLISPKLKLTSNGEQCLKIVIISERERDMPQLEVEFKYENIKEVEIVLFV
ncbi:DgyrCDS14531 [Dimorphilus gyrociliatus]|uniref:DgyrCDS14531 n=1 Tax=Dimorphilus gyrociliatus TaxID=2664684 RepID=A0A7I8WE72_9ANNE|nr:DgyrCDS14531 [Dimorphilus gyrociliatus]